jgi:pimeloyl-ACP methyl ester carboxylesterase
VVPTTRYAKSGEVNIAYQAFGDGPVDLVFVPGFISHIELAWEEPYLARFLRRLAAFTRVIFFDKRGCGLSDPVARPPGLVERMDDIRAVMDAASSQTAALFGVSDGGCLCIAFTVAHPERSAALVTYGSFARRLRSADYPWAGLLSTWRRCYAGWIRAGPAGGGGPRRIPALPMTGLTRHGGLAICGPPLARRWGAARSG